jgi:hypothetical protein
MQEIECPTCGKPMEVSVYYSPPDPSVGLSHDYEVTIVDAECDHEFTDKQHEEVFNGLWDRQQEANAANYEDEPRYARGYDDL